MFERLLIIGADFNALDAEGRVRVSLRYAATAEVPSVGEWVQLEDGEANSCLARIVEIEGLAVVAQADWSTWIPGEIARLSRSFAGTVRLGKSGDQPATEGAAPRVSGPLQAAA
jgi:hypothetical protein